MPVHPVSREKNEQSRSDIVAVRAASVRKGNCANTAVTIATTVFNIPMPATADLWRYVSLDIGTDDAVLAVAVNEDPTIGSGTDGSITWGVGVLLRGPSATLTPTEPLTSGDEIRAKVSTGTADTLVTIYKD